MRPNARGIGEQTRLFVPEATFSGLELTCRTWRLTAQTRAQRINLVFILIILLYCIMCKYEKAR